MEEYLTTKQVQELLKVDRITVYRMLGDGRLQGTKIGKQWRFTKQVVDRLLNGQSGSVPSTITDLEKFRNSFPSHCVQAVQNVFADLGNVGAVSVDVEGSPLTKVSHPCKFCALILSSEKGKAACRESWKDSIKHSSEKMETYTCHAGLHYRWEAIRENEETVAWLLAGQYLISGADSKALMDKLPDLAESYGLPVNALQTAAQTIEVLSGTQRDQVEAWPGKVVTAIEGILEERAGLVKRLNQIAEIVS